MARESFAAMTVVEVPQGSTSSYLVATIKSDGVALNLSAASGSKLYCAKTIGGAAVATDVAAVWFTNGSDGKVKIQMTAALVTTARDLLMDIEIQGFGGGNLVTRTFVLRILPRAKGI